MRVLLVDDDRDLLFIMARLVRQEGHEVIMLDDARDALKLLETDMNFDVILCDTYMPKMDGFHFLEKVRELQLHIPFILMTLSLEADWDLDCHDHGADYCLSKSCTREELGRALNESQKAHH